MSSNISMGVSVNSIRDAIIDDATRFSGADVVPKEDIRDAIIDDATRFSGADIVPKEDIRDAIIDDATRFSGGKVTGIIPYTVGTSIGAAASFMPVANTIVFTALIQLNRVMDIMYGVNIIQDGGDFGVNVKGSIGGCYCDGSTISYKNTGPSASTIRLRGVTFT